MRITKSKLKQLIKEVLEKKLDEKQLLAEQRFPHIVKYLELSMKDDEAKAEATLLGANREFTIRFVNELIKILKKG
jgi:hypothetical protein